VKINSGIPFSKAPNPPAAAFKLRGDAHTQARALECLTEAVLYEAGGEPVEGQRAVAQVVLNRVRHAAFPASVCGVVYQGSTRSTGCQFSFTCDGSLQIGPGTGPFWKRARAVANAALRGAVFAPVGTATHYHANYVVPYWATSLAKNQVVATHIFYRWPGWWGTPAAFRRSHAGAEPDPYLLREAALGAHPASKLATAGPATDPMAPQADPRVELVSVIQFLAAKSEPSEADSAYVTSVRRQFSPFSEHLAVQIYRQLSESADKPMFPLLLAVVVNYAPPPDLRAQRRLQPELVQAFGGDDKLGGFLSALRDFADHSDFESFFRAQQPFYKELAAAAEPPTLEIAAASGRGTRAEAKFPTITLAPMLEGALAKRCERRPSTIRATWLLVGTERDAASLRVKADGERPIAAPLLCMMPRRPQPAFSDARK
jgi:hypothetical protein